MQDTRFTRAVVATAVGAYALLVAGATAAVADVVRSCRSWPTCGGGMFPPASTDLLVVLGHRTLAVVVGVLVVTVAVASWRRGDPVRVRGALTVVAALYPVQVAVGALTATNGAVTPFPVLHLALGTAIFAAIVVALAWTLEVQTGDAPSPAEETERTRERAAPPGRDLPGPLATALVYARLTKPRLMWLLCLVAAAGMALAAGPALTVRTVVLTLGGGVLAIGASGTFNHALEYERDRKMARTADRPIAQHRVPRRNAFAFGVVLATASLAVFAQVNLLAAALGLAAILYYSVVYTLVLKPNTVQNTVIGGFAGSLPALIGWAAVSNRIGLPGLALAGVIFLWTPAHFYNLALAYREDYARGGFPMLPVVRGEAVTRKHILLYLGATLLGATALAAVADLGPLYAATSVAFGTVFLWAVVRLHRERTRSAALRSFHASNAYLGALLVAVVLDALAL